MEMIQGLDLKGLKVDNGIYQIQKIQLKFKSSKMETEDPYNATTHISNISPHKDSKWINPTHSRKGGGKKKD